MNLVVTIITWVNHLVIHNLFEVKCVAYHVHPQATELLLQMKTAQIIKTNLPQYIHCKQMVLKNNET